MGVPIFVATSGAAAGRRGLLREARLELGRPARREFAVRVHELTAAVPFLAAMAEPLLAITAG